MTLDEEDKEELYDLIKRGAYRIADAVGDVIIDMIEEETEDRGRDQMNLFENEEKMK